MDSKTQFQVLGWLNSASWDEKKDFLRSLVGVLTQREAHTLKGMVDKTRKSKRKQEIKEENAKRMRNERVPLMLSEPVPSSSAKLTPEGWWSDWNLDEIVAFDCEHVHLNDLTGSARVKAGSVAVYNGKRELLYEAKVKHGFDTYQVTSHTRKKNGFEKNSLIHGTPMEQVKRKVEEIFNGKLVLHFDGAKDFSGLGLFSGDFDNFDLSYYYRRPLRGKYGDDIGQRISLRSLCWHYFQKDIQSGVHSAKVDALYTLRLFICNYVPNVSSKFDKRYKNYSLFSHIVKYDPK